MNTRALEPFGGTDKTGHTIVSRDDLPEPLPGGGSYMRHPVIDEKVLRQIGFQVARTTVALMLLVVLPGFPASGVAQAPGLSRTMVCGGLCGDFNNSGTVTSADVIAMVTWLFLEGPPPFDFDCSDVDNYALITMRDVMWLVNYVFKGGAAPICPAGLPPIVGTPSLANFIYYEDVFPAGATTAELDLFLSTSANMAALVVPVVITVGGLPATIDNVVFGDGIPWTNHYFNVEPTGGPAGSVVLGMVTFSASITPGQYLLATIHLSATSDPSPRPVVFTWADLPPEMNSTPVNSPMFLDAALDAWEPHLAGSSELASISGTRYDDNQDLDCTLNGEPGLKNRMIIAELTNLAATTDVNGQYTLGPLLPGTYTVKAVPRTYWDQSCPPSLGTHIVTLIAGQAATGIDFGEIGQPNKVDLAIAMAGGRTRIDEDTEYGITLTNNGSVATGATITMQLSVLMTYISSSPAGSYDLGLHTLTWNVASIQPDDRLWFSTTLHVVPTALLDDIVNTQIAVVPTAGTDETPPDNFAVDARKIRASYDPNEKHVTPVGTGSSGWVARIDTMRYHIDFQNVGNDTAFLVVVRDTLDDDLDITTVVSGAGSDPYVFTVSGREMTWTFPGINLVDSATNEPGSHGFVEFSVRILPAAPDGAFLDNYAGIYFDVNPPVLTNTVSNRICPVSVPGDVNGDTLVTSSDIIRLVNYVFKSGAPPQPSTEAGDINCSGQVTSADIINLVNYVFKGGPPPCDICSVL